MQLVVVSPFIASLEQVMSIMRLVRILSFGLLLLRVVLARLN